jgi:hypothetical protein
MTAPALRPPLSVVVASIVGAPFIDACLDSLEAEARALGAEVIVSCAGAPGYADGIARRFPWARVISRPGRATVPALRLHGVEVAEGPIVGVIEEHCVAAPDWLTQALAGHARGDYAAVGGPIVDLGYDRLRDWVVYFCEYNGSLPPWPDAEVTELNGANVAYRRDVLLEARERLTGGYWEVTLHPGIVAAGKRFRSVPGMRVHHRGPFPFGYYLRQRYWFSRAYAGARAHAMPGPRRAAYLVAAPLVPLVLGGRMAARVWRKRCHVGRFVAALPLIVPALAALVAGEWVGYLAGPGDALSRVE